MIDPHSWRSRARPMIAEIIGIFSRDDDVAYVRKAVLASFPWTPRAMHPYRIWLDETRRQLAAFKARQEGYPVPPRGKACGPVPPPDPRQPSLFA